jgi:hypothetical protein
MINLLDYILDLFRDESHAQAFVANPDQALADAGLSTVNSARLHSVAATAIPSLAMGGSGDAVADLQQAVSSYYGFPQPDFAPQTDFSPSADLASNNSFMSPATNITDEHSVSFGMHCARKSDHCRRPRHGRHQFSRQQFDADPYVDDRQLRARFVGALILDRGHFGARQHRARQFRARQLDPRDNAHRYRPGRSSRALARKPSERRRFVAFGDVVVIEFAFGFDAAGEVLGPGVAAFGHHRAAIAA